MNVTVNGAQANARTGGAPPTGTALDAPGVLLIHGAGADGTAWQLQTRYLAHRGLRPLAVDLPGHGLTDGPALTTIEEMADWTAAFIGATDLAPCHIVGHSMGTFIAIDLAARRPELVRSLVLLGTASAMPVHPELLSKSATDVPAAAALMASWGHAAPAHVANNPSPGTWMLGASRALVEAGQPGSLAADFTACANYEGAADAAARITCPVTVIIGADDKMTPPKAAAKLVGHLDDPTVVELADTGHMLMTENPSAVRRALLAALTSS